MKDDSIWHISMKRKVDISPPGADDSPKYQGMLYGSTFRGIPGHPWAKCQFSLHSYVPNQVIFHMPPVLSKNVERRRKKNWQKKIFAIWDSLNSAKIGFSFSFFEEKCPKSILRPKWDALGVK